MSNGGGTPSRERQLQQLAGAISLGCAVAAVVTVLVSLGTWWDGSAPRATLAGVETTVVAPPQPLRAGEEFVRTEVLPSGDLVVTHWIESGQMVFDLGLALPEVAGAEALGADRVRVVADGRVAEGPEQVSPGVAVRYSFLGATSLEISYRLTGAVERSTSAPGRALARVSALDLTYEPPSRRVTRAVIAPEVLSLACAPPEIASTPAPCGEQVSTGEWTVELARPRGADRVIAQLSLE